MSPTPSANAIGAKVKLVVKARQIWGGFEDATLQYVTTYGGRQSDNIYYWERNAPLMRDLLARLSFDLDALQRNATTEMTLFLGAGPIGISSPHFGGIFEFGRACLLRLEGHYRAQEEEAMEAERLRVLSLLRSLDASNPQSSFNLVQLSEKTEVSPHRIKILLKQLRNDGYVRLSERIDNDVYASITEEGYRLLEEGAKRSEGTVAFNLNVVMGDNRGVQAAGDRQEVNAAPSPAYAELDARANELIASIRASTGTAEEKNDAVLDVEQLLLEARRAKPSESALGSWIGRLAQWSQALALGPNAAAAIKQIHGLAQSLPGVN